MKITLETKSDLTTSYISDKHFSDFIKLIEYIQEQDIINGEESGGPTMADYFKEMKKKK